MKLLRYAIAGLFALGLTATGLSANHPARYDGWDCCEPSPCCFETNACDVKYKIYGDFLYWDVAKTDLYAGTTTAAGTNLGEVQYLNPDYDYGFRVGAFAAWNRWDMGVRYTWYQNETSGTLTNPVVAEANASFKLDFNVVDIELGHAFRFCSSATFRPFVGAKLAWIRDHYDNLVTTAVPAVAGLAAGANVSNTRIKFEGYGVYLGAGGSWNLWTFDSCGTCMPISLVMRGSTGILRAQFNHGRITGVNGTPALTTANYTDHDAYIPVHEGYVGLETSFDAFCGTDICLQIGYEAQYWGWRKYNDISDTAHLGLGGLVVRGGLSF